MTLPLMPKATAVWLVENTTLTFEQIADFCGMHSLEIQAIADGDVAAHIMGFNPIANGQLTPEEIKRCEQDEKASLQLLEHPEIERLLNKGSRYVSQSKRGDRPSGIAWIVKHHPEISDAQIVKLLRTTKTTITAIRERTHKNIHNIHPKNPVTLGLCSESDLNKAIAVSVKRVAQ
ncbi:MAG: DUF1013 domain-containing protein [Alphaproteobacteria bacterium]|nr:DUF1013 domain-containing protein [Alphaproteobacteria bacterium]